MLYNCPRCGNVEFGGITYTQAGKRCALCSSPLGPAIGRQTDLFWNERADWALALPDWRPDQKTCQGVVREWRFIPDETPVIPTGWLYRVAGTWYSSWELKPKQGGEGGQ